MLEFIKQVGFNLKTSCIVQSVSKGFDEHFNHKAQQKNDVIVGDYKKINDS